MFNTKVPLNAKDIYSNTVYLKGFIQNSLDSGLLDCYKPEGLLHYVGHTIIADVDKRAFTLFWFAD